MQSPSIMSSDVCEEARQLSESYTLKVVLSTKCCLCIAGTFASILVLWRGGLSWLGFRPLTRSIFLGHVISSFVCSTLFALCYAFDVNRLSTHHENPCDYTLDIKFAFIARIFPIFGLFGSIYFMVFLAIERSVATLSPSTYHCISRGKGFILTTVHLAILLSIVVPLSFLLPPLKWDKRLSLFNAKTSENADLFQILVWFEIIPGLCALLIFHWALYTNHRSDPVENEGYLSERVQIESNKRVIHILLPVLWTHFVFNAFTSFTLALYPIFDPNPPLVSRAIVIECCNIIQMYPLTLAAILLYKLILRPLQLSRSQISSILDINKDVSLSTYFDQLRGYMDEGPYYGKLRWHEGLCC